MIIGVLWDEWSGLLLEGVSPDYVFYWFLCCVFIRFSFLSHCQDASSFFLPLWINLSSSSTKQTSSVCFQSSVGGKQPGENWKSVQLGPEPHGVLPQRFPRSWLQWTHWPSICNININISCIAFPPGLWFLPGPQRKWEERSMWLSEVKVESSRAPECHTRGGLGIN